MKRLATVGIVVSMFLLTACGAGGFRGIYSIPLPGGANLGSHPYKVIVQFRDVQDLVPQAAVKVNNVPVGRVDKISLGTNGMFAKVEVEVNGNVHLAANAVGRIDQSSLLGEKYVTLANPTDSTPTGTLANGATIAYTDTTAGVELEQVFGALSLLLNGGGVAQLKQITTELNKATTGREGQIRSFLTNVDSVVSQLNTHRDSITSALDSLNRLGASLRSNNQQIETVLADLSPGLKVLADQRTQLVTLLTSLNRLSTVSVNTLNASEAEQVADLKQLAPILTQLANAGSALPDSLQILLTYPFPDSVLAAIKGDYFNAFITTNLNTQGTVLARSAVAVTDGGTFTAGRLPSVTSSAPPTFLPSTSSALPGLASPTVTGTPAVSPSPSGSPTGSSTAAPAPSGSAVGSASPAPIGSGSSSSSSSPAPSTSGGHR